MKHKVTTRKEEVCPICLTSLWDSAQPLSGAEHIVCLRCGEYHLTGGAQSRLQYQDPKARAVLSHAVRRLQESSSSPPLVTEELAHHLLQSGSLPSPAQQAENFILWLGQKSRSLGDAILLETTPLTAIIGALSESGVQFLLNELRNQNLFVGDTANGDLITLTLKGWERYTALQKGQSRSRKGFMAMARKNEALTEIFFNYFKPAVQAAGFELIRVDEPPPAGLIDAHLRNEIRTSRFLVADLTDQNAGAYWEAGFAEGLGKPVIYTCEKEVFDQNNTHFDTKYFHTVLWTKDNPAEAGHKLKDTIRATLPAEAKLLDD